MRWNKIPFCCRLLSLALLCGGLLAASVAQAQVGARGVASISTAGGGAAFVRGNQALFLNPANLLFSNRSSRLTVTLGQASVFSGGDLLQFGYYNDTFTSGAHVPDSTIRAALDGLFGPSQQSRLRTAGAQADFVPLAISYRGASWALGVGLRTRVYSTLKLDRGLFDLVLLGTREQRTFPMNLVTQFVATTDLSIGYSRYFLNNRLAVGLAPKLVLGMNYADGHLTSTLEVTDEALTHQFDYTARSAGGFTRDFLDQFDVLARNPYAGGNPLEGSALRQPFASVAGTGAGLDLGLTYAVEPDWHVAASLTDWGVINWSEDTDVITPQDTTVRFEGLKPNSNRIGEQLDSLQITYEEVNRTDRAFTTPLPTALHLGSTWRPSRALTLTAGTSVALNDAAGNLTRRPSLHAGLEYVLGGRYAVPLRAGARVAGGGAFTLAGGFGLHTPAYDLDLGLSLTPRSDFLGKGGRYAIALSLANLRF